MPSSKKILICKNLFKTSPKLNQRLLQKAEFPLREPGYFKVFRMSFNYLADLAACRVVIISTFFLFPVKP